MNIVKITTYFSKFCEKSTVANDQSINFYLCKEINIMIIYVIIYILMKIYGKCVILFNMNRKQVITFDFESVSVIV